MQVQNQLQEEEDRVSKAYRNSSQSASANAIADISNPDKGFLSFFSAKKRAELPALSEVKPAIIQPFDCLNGVWTAKAGFQRRSAAAKSAAIKANQHIKDGIFKLRDEEKGDGSTTSDNYREKFVRPKDAEWYRCKLNSYRYIS